VRRVLKHGHPRLIIDFWYTNKAGAKERFRKVAEVQTITAARAEADRLRLQAATTGSVFESPKSTITLARFVDEMWRPLVSVRYRPATQLKDRASQTSKPITGTPRGAAGFEAARLVAIG
jgi:hypothetical protein